jgi:hypothetical protein
MSDSPPSNGSTASRSQAERLEAAWHNAGPGEEPRLEDFLAAVPEPAEAGALAAELAEAVHYPHSMGVIHRHLKPPTSCSATARTGRAWAGRG